MRTPDPDQPPLYAEPPAHVDPELEQPAPSTLHPVDPAPPRELADTGAEVSLLPAVLLIVVGIATLHAGRLGRRL